MLIFLLTHSRETQSS